MRKLRTLADVVDWGLCVGCGACAVKCGRRAISMTHVENAGYRPVFLDDRCAECSDCLSVCPGAQVTAPAAQVAGTDLEFGACLEIFEGWASDTEVRRQGSSGGVLSALSLYCLEQGGFAGIIHAGMDSEEPWRNSNFISRTRADVLARAGSRYAPSAPCEALSKPRPVGGQYVFVGKPCDTAAVSALVDEGDPSVSDVGLTLTFFCAGAPSAKGTLDLIGAKGHERAEVRSVRYRGQGWPGKFELATGDGTVVESMTYEDSWARLTPYRPLRCNLCPDGLGRLADISCGDAWHTYRDGDPGRSLILVRTERGRAVLQAAARAGYLTLRPATSRDVLDAQPSLLDRRRALFGRLLGLTLVGAPVPRYHRFMLLRSWLRLSPSMQARTLFGTIRRALTRGWHVRSAGGRRSDNA